MRRNNGAPGGLTDRGQNLLRREWHSVVLTVGVAVLVPVFAISVLALPPSAVERIAGPVLGSTLMGAQLPALDSPRQRTSADEAGAIERAEAASVRPGSYTAAGGSPFSGSGNSDSPSDGDAGTSTGGGPDPADDPTAPGWGSGSGRPAGRRPRRRTRSLLRAFSRSGRWQWWFWSGDRRRERWSGWQQRQQRQRRGRRDRRRRHRRGRGARRRRHPRGRPGRSGNRR